MRLIKSCQIVNKRVYLRFKLASSFDILEVNMALPKYAKNLVLFLGIFCIKNCYNTKESTQLFVYVFGKMEI